MELLTLFWLMLKIGAFTFGGGMAMVPLIQDSLVNAGLMTVSQASDIFAISNITPGPFAVNAATFVGMNLYGVPGALVATVGIVLPSVLMMAVVTLFFARIHKHPLTQAALVGVRAVVLGLIASAVWVIGKDAVFNVGRGVLGNMSMLDTRFNIVALALVLLLFWLMQRKKVSAVACIVGSGLFGALFLR